MEMESDVGLLRKFAADGSEDAFAELVRRHLGRVYGVALRKVGGDAHLAQDVAQTVFVSLARKAGRLAGREVIGGWLYRATHLAAVEALRARRRRQARELEAHMMNSPDEVVTDQIELRRMLDEALHQLGDADRDAVWLRFFEGRAFVEVGERLHLSENAARMRVDRALDKLNHLLARRGITSTASAIGVALANQAFGQVPPGLGAQVVSTGVSTAGQGGLSASGFLFMSKIKLIGGAALLGGVLAISWSVVEWLLVPKPAGVTSGQLRRNSLVPELAAEPMGAPAPSVSMAMPATSAVVPTVRRNGQGIPITSTAMQTQIRNNLRLIVSGRNMELKFRGRLPASVAEMVGPQGSIRELIPVNGEDYASIDPGSWRFKVTAADGIEIEYDAGAPKPSGPESLQETAQFRSELAAYQPPAAPPGQPVAVRNEFDASLIAIAEMKKRQHWESAFNLFRPEKVGNAWFAQFNLHTDFVKDGNKMRTSVYVGVWVREDGSISKYEANPPKTVVMPE
jgi:RNA polymerase sigma factor (sigma-70 family)